MFSASPSTVQMRPATYCDPQVNSHPSKCTAPAHIFLRHNQRGQSCHSLPWARMRVKNFFRAWACHWRRTGHPMKLLTVHALFLCGTSGAGSLGLNTAWKPRVLEPESAALSDSGLQRRRCRRCARCCACSYFQYSTVNKRTSFTNKLICKPVMSRAATSGCWQPRRAETCLRKKSVRWLRCRNPCVKRFLQITAYLQLRFHRLELSQRAAYEWESQYLVLKALYLW